MATNLKCPVCGMNKFKKKFNIIKFRGQTEAETLNAVALTCTICGNIMFNANDISKFKGQKVKDYKLTK